MGEAVERAGYNGSTKFEDVAGWITRASKADMERELTRIYTANDPAIEGDIACKIMSYDWAHQDAVALGYESLTEALEALSALTAMNPEEIGDA